MKNNIEEILNSMDYIQEQSPSYYFKEQVLKKYYSSKKKVQCKFEQWFPWFDFKYQLSLGALVLLFNMVSIASVSKKVNYQNDLQILSQAFNVSKNE